MGRIFGSNHQALFFRRYLFHLVRISRNRGAHSAHVKASMLEIGWKRIGSEAVVVQDFNAQVCRPTNADDGREAIAKGCATLD